MTPTLIALDMEESSVTLDVLEVVVDKSVNTTVMVENNNKREFNTMEESTTLTMNTVEV